MPKQQKTGRKTGQSAGTEPLKKILIAGVTGTAVTFLVLLLCSWLYTKTQLPAWSAVPMATCAVCLGCFVCGMILARSFKKNGLFCGLCTGTVFYLIYLAAALLNGQFDFTAMAGIKLVCYILAGCFGGYLGILLAERKHTRRPA